MTKKELKLAREQALNFDYSKAVCIDIETVSQSLIMSKEELYKSVETARNLPGWGFYKPMGSTENI